MAAPVTNVTHLKKYHVVVWSQIHLSAHVYTSLWCIGDRHPASRLGFVIQMPISQKIRIVVL